MNTEAIIDTKAEEAKIASSTGKTTDRRYKPKMSTDSAYPRVDRRSGLSLKEFKREYLHPGKPVVITDAMREWRASSAWTFDFFKSGYGKTEAKVHRYDEEKEFTPDNIKHIPLAEYVDGITTKDWNAYPYYLRDNWKILFEHKELMADYKIPEYFFDWFKLLPSALRMPYPRLFLGPKGAMTPVHVDIWGTHAWLSQLVGRKRWLLFSPAQEAFLYNCKVRVDDPDFEKYPLYRKAAPLEATIGPGDTIFVPSRWAHWVVSLDPTISLSANYMGPGCFRVCLSNTFRDVFFQRLVAKIRR